MLNETSNANEHIFERAGIHFSKIDLVIGPGLLLDGNTIMTDIVEGYLMDSDED